MSSSRSLGRRIEHVRLRRYLDAHVDGEIADETLARKVGGHVAGCPMCDAAADTTMAVKRRLSLRRFLPSTRPGDVTPHTHGDDG